VQTEHLHNPELGVLVEDIVLESTKQLECDVLVVGGGINGAAIARDAAGRGLRVVLCEKDDLAQHTSSASTKLIHGGLRYLEHLEFRLVRKALIEREILLGSAPHIMRPLRFVMPHEAGLRPAWVIKAGLFLYDRLAKRNVLPGSHEIDLTVHPAGEALQARFTRGFMYSDGWVDDARLVVLNALDARERGATVLTRTRCTLPQRVGDHWVALLETAGEQFRMKARCVVNATGPWATHFIENIEYAAPGPKLRLVKGSHIVVPRLFDHLHAYIFQHSDRRIVFAIPYEQKFTLIGTTDVDFRGDLNNVGISLKETTYLCDLVNRYFERCVTPSDVLWSFSGVRPLVDDSHTSAATATRDYWLRLDKVWPPLLSVFGGKITTSRILAEEAVNRIIAILGLRAPSWTAKSWLPGGDLFSEHSHGRSVLEFDLWVAAQAHRYPWLPRQTLERFARTYGTRMHTLLERKRNLPDLGSEALPGVYAAEVDYLVKYEWAMCAADILWRRTKLALHLASGSEARLDNWLAANSLLGVGRCLQPD
jgi:glycerol-3-phosphate dehydrogenase